MTELYVVNENREGRFFTTIFVKSSEANSFFERHIDEKNKLELYSIPAEDVVGNPLNPSRESAESIVLPDDKRRILRRHDGAML